MNTDNNKLVAENDQLVAENDHLKSERKDLEAENRDLSCEIDRLRNKSSERREASAGEISGQDSTIQADDAEGKRGGLDKRLVNITPGSFFGCGFLLRKI